ncbi:hypothetical protein AKJ44_02670 [candidate division MSBL1 archaeon SCGC-AAA261F17]|uniref:Hydrogenase maturation protease n=1 Tax=candidate division MSBL1 archaeon SCGC-AAA261F17 TaxID=1698274 RepID=A0A133V4G7_9EURY|nr:hypothetical protein AKJ44_02670 [candidate division MSBL1 archaeon SCGC-AAA261F17]
MKTLILGIGNEIRRDDAVGLIVAREVYNRIGKEGIDLKEASSAGLSLLGKIKGYDRVFLIDSIMTKDGKPRDWYSLSLDDLAERRSGITSHTVDLRTMKEMGGELGEAMPKIRVYAIEVKEPFEFSENLTKEVEDSIWEVISGVLNSIKEEISS